MEQRRGQTENGLHGTVDGLNVALEVNNGVGKICNELEHIVDLGVELLSLLGNAPQATVAHQIQCYHTTAQQKIDSGDQ